MNTESNGVKPVLVGSLLAAIAAIVLISFVLFLFHWLGKGKKDEDPDGGTVGHARSILASLFLLVFAIGIVVPWTDADAARQNTYAEAQALTEAYWSAGSLPASGSVPLRAGLRDYTAYVVGREWPLMEGGRLGTPGWTKLDAIRSQLAAARFADKDQQDAQSDVLSQLRTVYQARRQRASDAETTLPPAVLIFVVLIGVLILAFPFLSGARPHGATLVPLAFMAALLGVSVYLVFAIDHTFSGGLAVKPTAFTDALQEYQRTP